jgi:thiol:disulfide interchange protein DsbD
MSGGVIWGQDEEKIIEVKVLGSAEKLIPGRDNPIAVELQIHKPWHVNGNIVADDFLIPTVLEFNPGEGLSFGEIQYPASEEKIFAFSETPVLVYEEMVYVHSTVSVGSDFAGKDVTISGVVSYQACNDESCLAPADIEFSKTFNVAGKDEQVKEINETIFGSAARPPVPPVEEGSGDGDLAHTIESKGLFLTFFVIFLAGLALNLTPCVYPLIPITISYFGGQAGDKKGSLFLLSLVYVLGMAITYSVLGVFAALTGSILGTWLQNPWVLIFIAAVMVTLALSMFGLYEIRVPMGLANFAGQSKQGYFGTLRRALYRPFCIGIIDLCGRKRRPGDGLYDVLCAGHGPGSSVHFPGIV